jgi:hypothetical protein
MLQTALLIVGAHHRPAVPGTQLSQSFGWGALPTAQPFSISLNASLAFRKLSIPAGTPA